MSLILVKNGVVLGDPQFLVGGEGHLEKSGKEEGKSPL